MKAVRHENIVKCKELILDRKKKVHIVFEYIRGGNLEALARKRNTPFLETQVRSVFYQLLSAISHLHAFDFLHRDIKPENILIEPNVGDDCFVVKLADLGLATQKDTARFRPQTTYVATRWYRSPELLLHLQEYGFPSDMWAVGAVMAEFISLGRPLFPGDDEADQLSKIISLRGHPGIVGWKEGATVIRKRNIAAPRVTPSSLRSSIPYASSSVLQLISELLEMDPGRRPSADDALRNPIFQDNPRDNLFPVSSFLPKPSRGDIDNKELRDYASSRPSDNTDSPHWIELQTSHTDLKRKRNISRESTISPISRPTKQTTRSLHLNSSPYSKGYHYQNQGKPAKRQPAEFFDLR